jgi:hypothetical protein
MGLRDKLGRLERAASEETVLARCLECGEEKRIRGGIMLDLVALDWQTRHDGSEADELPDDVRWVRQHPCDPLLMRDKQTGGSIFGAAWERAARAARERETDEE